MIMWHGIIISLHAYLKASSKLSIQHLISFYKMLHYHTDLVKADLTLDLSETHLCLLVIFRLLNKCIFFYTTNFALFSVLIKICLARRSHLVMLGLGSTSKGYDQVYHLWPQIPGCKNSVIISTLSMIPYHLVNQFSADLITSKQENVGHSLRFHRSAAPLKRSFHAKRRRKINPCSNIW